MPKVKKHVAFSQMPVDAWRYTKDLHAIGLLSYICDHINVSGYSYAFPAYSKIEEDLGLSRATIAKKIKLLENAGLIVVEHGTRKSSNRYFPNFRDRIGILDANIGSSENELGSLNTKLGSLNTKLQVVHEMNCNNNHINNNHINNTFSKEKDTGFFQKPSPGTLESSPFLEGNEIPHEYLELINEILSKNKMKHRPIDPIKGPNKTHVKIYEYLKSMEYGEFLRSYSMNEEWVESCQIKIKQLRIPFKDLKYAIISAWETAHASNSEGFPYTPTDLSSFLWNPRKGKSWFVYFHEKGKVSGGQSEIEGIKKKIPDAVVELWNKTYNNEVKSSDTRRPWNDSHFRTFWGQVAKICKWYEENKDLAARLNRAKGSGYFFGMHLGTIEKFTTWMIEVFTGPTYRFNPQLADPYKSNDEPWELFVDETLLEHGVELRLSEEMVEQYEIERKQALENEYQVLVETEKDRIIQMVEHSYGHGALKEMYPGDKLEIEARTEANEMWHDKYGKYRDGEPRS